MIRAPEHASTCTNVRLQKRTFAADVHNKCMGRCINIYAVAGIELKNSHTPAYTGTAAKTGKEKYVHGPV